MYDHTRTLHGLTFSIEIQPDEHSGPPWEQCDLFIAAPREVRSYEGRPEGKRPHERVLCKDRYRAWLYDWNAAMHKARQEFATAKEAHEAVEHEYSWLKAWYHDKWWYQGVVVCVTVDDRRYGHSLWGIESTSDEAWLEEIVTDLIHETLAKVLRDAGLTRADFSWL